MGFFSNKTQVPSIDQRLVGSWYAESDRNTKLVFSLKEGLVKKYWSEELRWSYNYSVSHACNDNYDEKFYFMKWETDHGEELCFEINGVNENNSGILSLTSMQNGKVYLYKR